MLTLLEAQLRGVLSPRFLLDTAVGAKVVGVHALEPLADEPLTVRIWIEADADRGMCWRKFAWVSAGDALPDEPARYVGSITPGRAALHLYEIMTGPTKEEIADVSVRRASQGTTV